MKLVDLREFVKIEAKRMRVIHDEFDELIKEGDPFNYEERRETIEYKDGQFSGRLLAFEEFLKILEILNLE